MITNDAFLASHHTYQRSKEGAMVVTVSEDLSAASGSPYRFCATVVNDDDPDRAGFGPTEEMALARLAHRYSQTVEDFLDGVAVERLGFR